jgi:3-oxoadipate enol-lactonase
MGRAGFADPDPREWHLTGSTYDRAMTFVLRDGVELHYERAGTGMPLVWGHGLTSSRAGEDELGITDWSRLRHVADVVRYDARGHGASGSSDNLATFGWDALAGDQLALADHLGIDRYVVGGASMGAATALHVACQAPDRVLALILMIPPTAWETRAAQVDVYESMASIIDGRGVEPLIAARADVAPPDPFSGSTIWSDRSARAMRAADPQRLSTAFRGAATANFPTRDEVAAIAVPTLILAWTGDPGHPVSTADELVGLLPETEMCFASTADELAEWSGVIAAFIERTPMS